MVEISTISLIELNRLIGTLHGWELHADRREWRASVLTALLSALDMRAGVFGLTWDEEPLVWAYRREEKGGYEIGHGALPTDFRQARAGSRWHWPELLDGGCPPFGEFIDTGHDCQERRWDEFQGPCVYREHEGGEVSWMGLFEPVERPEVFAGQSLPLLRILFPAFAGSTDSCRKMTGNSVRMSRLVNAFQEPAILIKLDGSAAFRNRALDVLIHNEPESDEVERRFQELQEEFLADPQHAAAEGADRSFELSRGEYRIQAEFLADERTAPRSWVLIRVEASAPVLPDAPELARRFKLTPREIEVTLLLARGFSTKAVARDLEITWHTARRHVENTLKKLEVSSRAKVMDRILTRG
jgi:DNA-binding CsgD family transcriptional regulator